MPCVICTRSGAKLKEGRAIPPIAVIAAEAAALLSTPRRVSAVRLRILAAIGPPSSRRRGRCSLILTKARILCDGGMTLLWCLQQLFRVPCWTPRSNTRRRASAKRSRFVNESLTSLGCRGLRAVIGDGGSGARRRLVDDCRAARADREAKLVKRE